MAPFLFLKLMDGPLKMGKGPSISYIFVFLKLMDGPFYENVAYGWPLFEAYGWPPKMEKDHP